MQLGGRFATRDARPAIDVHGTALAGRAVVVAIRQKIYSFYRVIEASFNIPILKYLPLFRKMFPLLKI